MSDFCKKHNIDHYGTWCGECVMLWKKHSDEYKKLKNKMKLNFSKELNKQILNLLNRLNKVGSKIPTTERGNMTREEKIEALAEEWVSVPGYEGLYDVSNLGRVRSLRFRRKFADILREHPLVMRGAIKSNGYVHLQLSDGSKKKTFSIHVLALTAFVGPRPLGYEAAHLDGNRSNNKLKNLKWCTKKENVSHLKDHGTVLYGAKNPMTRLTEKQVIDIRKTYSVGNCSIKKLAKKYDVGTSTVWRIVSGKYWRHLKHEQFMKAIKGDG